LEVGLDPVLGAGSSEQESPGQGALRSGAAGGRLQPTLEGWLVGSAAGLQAG